MALPTDLPEHLSAIQSFLDDCSQDDLSLINAYIVDRAKQQQANSRAEHMARFRAGDRVSFRDKNDRLVEATVVRTNKKTVTLLSDSDTKWNVSPELLSKIESSDDKRDKPTQLSLVQNDRSASTASPAADPEGQWVGGWIDAPGFITEEEGAPYRPRIHVWLNDSGQIIRMALKGPDDPELDPAEELAMAITEPATGPAGAPSQIRVNDAEQARILRATFPTINVVCAETPELSELQSVMEREMAPVENKLSYAETGASTEAIGEFFETAATLYRAKPWNIIPHAQSLISVSIDALGLKQAPLSVIGQAGQNFGIILFDQLAFHERYTLIGDALHRGLEPDSPPHTFLSFDPAKEVDASLRKEISRHGWKVANNRAYPLLMAPVEDRMMRPITPHDVTLFNALAQALTAALSNRDFVAAHNGGAPTIVEKTVSSDSGPLKIVLESPYPYERVMRENGAADSILAGLIAMERTSDERDWDLHDSLTTQLQEKYQASPEAKAIDTAASVSTLIIDFSFNYLNCTVATLNPADLEQILYEIIPAKVMMPASEADNMIEDARAFFSFLKRAYQSVHADRCLSILTDDAAIRMRSAMDNPDLFGMGKSALSEGTGFPFDMPGMPGIPGMPPELPGPSATKPKPKDRKSRKKQRAATKKSRKKNR